MLNGGGAHLRHLTNTVERSVRGGDGALPQINLTALIVDADRF